MVRTMVPKNQQALEQMIVKQLVQSWHRLR
jgi:hypothetical protein